jgi:hypothetical protein
MLTLWLVNYIVFGVMFGIAIKSLKLVDNNNEITTFGDEFPYWNLLVGLMWPAVLIFMLSSVLVLGGREVIEILDGFNEK